MVPWGLVLGLTGCGYSHELFAEEFPVALCSYYEECDLLDTFGFDSKKQCTKLTRQNYDPKEGTIPCEEYVGENAEKCVSQVKRMDCGDPVGSTMST